MNNSRKQTPALRGSLPLAALAFAAIGGAASVSFAQKDKDPANSARIRAAAWHAGLPKWESGLYEVTGLATARTPGGKEAALTPAEVQPGDPEMLPQLMVYGKPVTVFVPAGRPAVRKGDLVHLTVTAVPVYGERGDRWTSYVAFLPPTAEEAAAK